MTSVRTVLRWAWDRAFFIIAFVGLAVGIASLTVSFNASTKATEANARVAEEASQRAALVEAQAEHQRLTFCGVFETIAEAGKIPPPQPRTQFGESIVKGSQKVVSPEGLACTPDPFDGR